MDKDIQTDAEKFFSFVLDFLSLLENRITSGEISIDEVLEHGHLILEAENACASARWLYQPESPVKEQEKQAIMEL